jgi:hypothetical protein
VSIVMATALDTFPLRRRDYLQHVDTGIQRIAQGLLYKFIIGYLIYSRALDPMAHRSGVARRAGVHARLQPVTCSSISPATAPSPSASGILRRARSGELQTPPAVAGSAATASGRTHVGLVLTRGLVGCWHGLPPQYG